MNEVERVKAICKERRIAISRLEKACGFSNGYIRSLKEGKMPSDRLYAVSVFLELPMEYLLTGAESPQERFTAYECELLRMFRLLNADGQSEALRDIRNLTRIREYTDKRGSSSSLEVG